MPDGGGRESLMFQAENIRDWRDHSVVDPDGSKIGQLEAVYVDTGTDIPAFASVKTGRARRRKLIFVPLSGATVAPSHVRVTYPKKQVKNAPEMDMDGELAASEEPGLFQYYGLTYQPGASGERRLARR
jgi:hypothetical protein